MSTFRLTFVHRLCFLATAALITLSGCQNKTSKMDVNPSSAPEYALRGDGGDDAANEANPYDYFGLAHNQSLQATRSVWTNNNATLRDVSTAVTSYVQQTYDPTAVPASDAIIQQDMNRIQADLRNFGSNIIAGTQLSAAGKVYANQMSQALYNAPSTSSYSDIRNEVVNIESQIMNNAQLPATDRAALLKMASVGRYSLLYWLNETAGANTGRTLLRTSAVSGPIPAASYRLIVVVSYTDYMSSTTVYTSGNWVIVETVTIHSAGIAVFYF